MKNPLRLLVFLCLPCPTLEAQVRVIDSAEHCQCRLEAELTTSLGQLSDSDGMANTFFRVEHLPDGTFIVAGTLPKNRILVYTAEGELSGQWGRDGEGPGEFRNISALKLIDPDSTVVFDTNQGRVTVLNADGEYVRSFRILGNVMEVEWTQSGWAHNDIRGVGDPVFPVRRVSPTGQDLGPFGPSVPGEGVRPSRRQRTIAASSAGVWMARPDRYELELWDHSGQLVGTLDRIVDWFPDRETEGARNTPETPPSPWLRDIHTDDEGYVWTMTAVPDPDWLPVYSQPDDDEYDTVVEIIDPASGEVLGSQRFDWAGDGFTSDGLIYSAREADFGLLVLDIWRIRRPR